MSVWEEIVDYTVPSSTTSVTLNNFGTITKDDFIKVLISFNCANVGSLALLANNSARTDYYFQYIQAFTNNISSGRENTNEISFPSTNEKDYIYAYLKLSENNKFNIFASSFRDTSDNNGNDLGIRFFYNTSTINFTSGITSLILQSNQTNGIGTNSRIQIYRLTAEKVADITVASNTDQVDITGLNIDKGSEYLLITDMADGTGSNYNLGYNDNTSESSYYHQRIIAEGSSASAGRSNNAHYLTRATNSFRSLAYSHIKISNIGSFTNQSYGMVHNGSSDIRLFNFFISSTAENITNINKLNIFSLQTVLSGTRFELYKLY